MTHSKYAVLLIVSFLTALIATHVDAESNIRTRIRNGEQIRSERDEQASIFDDYFQSQDLTYETEFAKLKTSASVPAWRIPYAASIHPERSGGLSAVQTSCGPVLSKYDQAFNGGKNLAYQYDRSRKVSTSVRRGLFGSRRTVTYNSAESWEGYCSGFTASTILHAEPVRPVDAGLIGGKAGVIFQPSEIKALLSAAYNRTRNDSYRFVAPATARDGGPNMGTFHLALANYIGQGGHPVGIDRTKGYVSWNNPIYQYEVTSLRDAGKIGDIHYKELTTKITYAWYGNDTTIQTNLETGDRQGNLSRSMSVRYYLELDRDGKIVGGRALSQAGHFLWLPMFAVQGIRDQSSPGNPHLDVRKVIALARHSALPIVQEQYDRLAIGTTVDPQIAIRAEKARLQALAEQAERERVQREQAERLASEQALAQSDNADGS